MEKLKKYLLPIIAFLTVPSFFMIANLTDETNVKTYELSNSAVISGDDAQIILENVKDGEAVFKVDGKTVNMKQGDSKEIEPQKIGGVTFNTEFNIKEVKYKTVVIEVATQKDFDMKFIALLSATLAILVSITQYLFYLQRDINKEKFISK